VEVYFRLYDKALVLCLMARAGLLNAILERAFVRSFEEGRSVLKKILLAGVRAPSAGNIQLRTFIVVKDEKVKKTLYELCENQAFMKAVSVWIVVCLDFHRNLKAAKLTGVNYDFEGFYHTHLGFWMPPYSLRTWLSLQKLLKLPEHDLSILCIEHLKKKLRRREKWSYRL